MHERSQFTTKRDPQQTMGVPTSAGNSETFTTHWDLVGVHYEMCGEEKSDHYAAVNSNEQCVGSSSAEKLVFFKLPWFNKLPCLKLNKTQKSRGQHLVFHFKVFSLQSTFNTLRSGTSVWVQADLIREIHIMSDSSDHSAIYTHPFRHYTHTHTFTAQTLTVVTEDTNSDSRYRHYSLNLQKSWLYSVIIKVFCHLMWVISRL